MVGGGWWVVGGGGGRGGWGVAGGGWRVGGGGVWMVVVVPSPFHAPPSNTRYDWITPDHLLEVNPVCVGVCVCGGGVLFVCLCVCVCVWGGGEGYCVILPCNPQLPTL